MNFFNRPADFSKAGKTFPFAINFRHCSLSLVAAAAAFNVATPLEAAPKSGALKQVSETSWEKGRILAMPRAGLAETELVKIITMHNGRARKLGQSNLYIVDLPLMASPTAVLATLKRNPHLKFAELDRKVDQNYASNDPFSGSQWHVAKIGAPTAWDVSEGANITIAVLDTGIDSSHPDLKNQLVAGFNFYDKNTNISDVQGHGTAVAGAAAAVTNNGIGVAGIAGRAKIMPLRVSDPTGSAYLSTIAEALVHAADHGARVANISYIVADSSAVKSAADYMKMKGGLVVVGAGNNGIDENISPSTSLIPVSATDNYDKRASWSSYGNFVAMSAPGTGIYTTTKGGGYGGWNGTSFSSPITAGVVALMMSARPTMENTQIESILYKTAVDLGLAGRDSQFGYGRVNALGAMQGVINEPLANDSIAPTASIAAPLANATVSGIVPVNVTATDNVGVSRVELKVNGTVIAVDSSAPFGFSWDSTGAPNGIATITAYAYDAANNVGKSADIAVNVANAVATVAEDLEPPKVAIVNPTSGVVNGKVSVSITASDNSDQAGIRQYLYIDGALKASGSGTTLGYSWNTRNIKVDPHTLKAVAIDASGNSSTVTVQVTK